MCIRAYLLIITLLSTVIAGAKNVRYYEAGDSIEYDTIPYMIRDEVFEESFKEWKKITVNSIRTIGDKTEYAYVLRTPTLLKSDSQITNYRIIPERTGKIRIGGCWVNNLQDNLGMSAPGSTIYVPIKSKNPFTAHKLKNFKTYFEP